MGTFLTPLRATPTGRLILRNERTGTVIADHLLPAFDSTSRRTGLLKHESLPAGTAMIIAPTNAIHTFFMKFAIDVAFVGRQGRILKIREGLPAWRMSAALGGFAVVEMAAGSFRRAGTEPGDTVIIETDSPS